MHTAGSPQLNRRRRAQRGSAIIEAAFVTPVFLLLLFGILEYGLLFRNNLTTNNASQEGARAASVGGRALEADYLTLQTLEHGLAAMEMDQLNYVVIYNANDPSHATSPGVGYELPDASLCHTQSVQQLCNRYVAADFEKDLVDGAGDATDFFRCIGTDPTNPSTAPAAGNLDGFWCPGTRNAGLGNDSDLVGVYVNTTHAYLTGFFGESQTLDASTVIRVEPDEDS